MLACLPEGKRKTPAGESLAENRTNRAAAHESYQQIQAKKVQKSKESTNYEQ